MRARVRDTAFASIVLGSGLLLTSACGNKDRAPASQTKVVNGEDVRAGDPLAGSTVALVSFLGQEFCSGTLIDKRHIITAAHCKGGVGFGFLAAFGPVAKAGVTPDDHVIIGASFHANEAFNAEAATRGAGEVPINDIALVTLSADAPSDATPVPFLSRGDSLQPGDTITVAGYGLTGGNANGTNGVLRKTQSKVTETFITGKEFVLGDSNGRACNGDSGGPAYVVRDGRLVLAGVVSRGEAGCGGLVIYTDVRYFIDWINQA